jgi:hypothetical protein
MALVTLIGEKLAIKGMEFEYIGPNNDCRNCKLKTVCFNLKPGRRYKITNIRDKKHSCNVHEGAAAVVEVEEKPIITSIDKKHKKGEEAKIEKVDCDSIGCDNYEICKVSLQKDKKYVVVNIIKDIKCPLDYNLKEAELKEL